MGSPKALLELRGETFLGRLIDAFLPICHPLIVVLGYDAERIRAATPAHNAVEFVLNPDPARGMFSSLQCGLRALPPTAGAAIFTPVDYAAIRSASVAGLARAYQQFLSPVTLPRHQGEHGHPVCISRLVIDQLLALPVTAQARDVIHAHRSQTAYLDLDDPGILSDIDSPEDYRRLVALK
jgi:molybdenum cofactor cytidylyltransferase